MASVTRDGDKGFRIRFYDGNGERKQIRISGINQDTAEQIGRHVDILNVAKMTGEPLRERQTACSCEVKTSPTLSQALHLLNGESTTGKIAEGGVIDRLIEQNSDPMTVVTALYERCLSRQPTAEEVAAISERLKSSTDVKASLSDLFWALLNSNEFVFNH